MMQVLDFAPRREAGAGEDVRRAYFRVKSTLSLKLACDLAKAVQRLFAERWKSDAEVFLYEPFVPEQAAAAQLLQDAVLYEVTAERARFWIVFETHQARRLVASAFDETETVLMPVWSSIEKQTLLRMVHDLALCVESIVGKVSNLTVSADHYAVLAAPNWLSLRIGTPIDGECLLVFAHNPAEAPTETLGADALLDVPAQLRVVAEVTRISLKELIALEIGTVLPMSREYQARLLSGTACLAQGTCGVSQGRLAFLIGTIHESQGV